MKPFAEQGHYTAVHDAVFDRIMPRTPPNAFKVLLLILRKTRGWGKETDALSYTEIRAGTGISSDSTVHSALVWLAERDLILTHEGGHKTSSAYSLNRDYVMPTTTETRAQPTTEIVADSTTETVGNNKQREIQEKTTRSNERVERARAKPAWADECVGVLLGIRALPKPDKLLVRLSEYAEEYPSADPATVCRDLDAWHEDHPGKPWSTNRLRAFFQQEHANPRRTVTTEARGNADGPGRWVGEDGKERDHLGRTAEDKRRARERRRAGGYDHLFGDIDDAERPAEGIDFTEDLAAMREQMDAETAQEEEWLVERRRARQREPNVGDMIDPDAK